VYAGQDPITKRPHYLTETVPAGTPNIDKVAEKVLTRLLSQVDERRASRTNATVGQLIDAYLEVVDIDRTTMRGWRGKVKNHIRPQLGTTPLGRRTPTPLAIVLGVLPRHIRPELMPSHTRVCDLFR